MLSPSMWWPTAVKGATGQQLSFRNPVVLAAECNFTGTDEMPQYIHGSRFWPFFETYAKQWIWPLLTDSVDDRWVLGVTRFHGGLMLKLEMNAVR